MCGEANVDDEEDEEERQEETNLNESNTEAQLVLHKKVADYDYLVGMAMWKLSTEDKDKMLEESQFKKDELVALENKTWINLWDEDLKTFLAALEIQVIIYFCLEFLNEYHFHSKINSSVLFLTAFFRFFKIIKIKKF